LEFLAEINSGIPAQTIIMNIGSINIYDKVISDTVNTVVLFPPKPILEIAKEVDLASAFAGDTLEYTLTIINTGDLAAKDVEINDNIPEFTTFIPGSAIGSTSIKTSLTGFCR